MIRKTFENHDKNSIPGLTSYIPILDKFILKTFNWLSYNKKINELLATSFLFDLLDYYFLKAAIKTINIALLKEKF